MNRSKKLSLLLALLLVLGSTSSLAVSSEIESCLGGASCLFDNADTQWLENDKDADDPDSHSGEANTPGLSPGSNHSFLGLFLALATPALAHSQIRAPPYSL